MEIINQEMPRKYTLIQAQDFHIGSSTVHKKGVEACRDRLMDDDVFAVMPGDLIECITPNDKRYSLATVDMEALTPQAQARKFCEIFEPVKDKILVCGMGNHEWKTLNNIYNPIRDICDRLEAQFGGYSFVFVATNGGKVMHRFFFTHGSGQLNSNAKDSVQKLGNLKASLKNTMNKYGLTDCIYMGRGHTHKPMIVEPTIADEVMLVTRKAHLSQKYRHHADQTADYIPPDARWYGNGASFLRGYADSGSGVITYAEVAGYGPVELGWLELDIEDGQLVNVRKVVV